jgi:hypothetical protein
MSHDIQWNQKRKIRNDYKSFIRRFLLFPDLWRNEENEIPEKLEWKKIKFNNRNLNQIPTFNGLYCFVVIPTSRKSMLFETRYLFYIGKASSASLKQRFKDYINERDGKGKGKSKPRIKIQEMLMDYKKDIYFFYTTLSDSTSIENYETKLINMFVPYVNTQIPQATIQPELKHIY